METHVAPLLDALEFVDNRQRCGSPFRFGLLALSDHDMGLIAEAMGASQPALRMGLGAAQTPR